LYVFLSLTLLFIATELFLTLYVLFRIGSVATRDLNFTSTQEWIFQLKKSISQRVPSHQVPHISEPNDNIDVGRNPFSTSFSELGASSEPLETHEAQFVQSNHSLGQQDGEGGKKQSQVACVLGKYLEFKKDQPTMILEELK
jgi:hypothetical protein